MNTFERFPDHKTFDLAAPALPVEGPPHPATLLIPADLEPILEKRLAFFSNKPGNYILYLAKKFRRLSESSSLPVSLRLRTRYQPIGLSLSRLNFRVEILAWHALKIIARSHGISMCLAFTILLLMEHEQNERVLTKQEERIRYDRILCMDFHEEMNIMQNRYRKKMKMVILET